MYIYFIFIINNVFYFIFLYFLDLASKFPKYL